MATDSYEAYMVNELLAEACRIIAVQITSLDPTPQDYLFVHGPRIDLLARSGVLLANQDVEVCGVVVELVRAYHKIITPLSD